MRYLNILITPIIVIIYWQLIAGSGWVSPYLLPEPLTVWHSALEMWQSGQLPQHLQTSLWRVAKGFLLSCLFGFILAGLTHCSKLIDHLLSAPLALFRMIPPLAMIPLLILWLGIGDSIQLAIIILASIFPIYLNTQAGLKRVDFRYQELAISLHLSRLRYTLMVVIPSAIPSIVTGIRLGFGYSWRALIGAELIAASSGLGYLIIDAQEMQRTDVVMVGILTIGLIGWLLDTLFYALLKRTLAPRFPEIH